MENNLGLNLQNTYVDLPEVFYEKVSSNTFPQLNLVLYNEELGTALGLNNDEMQAAQAVEILAGNKLLEKTTPIAQSYAGHQFGHFTMLGDGRAKLLGEQLTPTGERVDLQLKGAGRTRYSRGGDGLATLGPMIREYLMSEALYRLGVPTTRSLAVVTTGAAVRREVTLEGAVLTRAAASHLRVGTFQFAAAYGELGDLVSLADYAIERHDPEVKGSENHYVAFLRNVIARQAALIAKWQLIGFIHGVMNTDNMTISGETIDYGPCAFMDNYREETVFSSIDLHGRYAYRNQPGIAAWNLARLAEALLPLLGSTKEEAIEKAQAEIAKFAEHYGDHWLRGMRAKLGIFNEEKEDKALIDELLALMEHYQVDYTNTFLSLTFNDEENFPMGKMEDFLAWKEKWQARLDRQANTKDEVITQMKAHNPALIPRNQWVEEAIEAAVQDSDYSLTEELLAVLNEPYAHTEEQRRFRKRRFDTYDGYQTFCGT